MYAPWIADAALSLATSSTLERLVATIRKRKHISAEGMVVCCWIRFWRRGLLQVIDHPSDQCDTEKSAKDDPTTCSTSSKVQASWHCVSWMEDGRWKMEEGNRIKIKIIFLLLLFFSTDYLFSWCLIRIFKITMTLLLRIFNLNF